MAWRDITAAGLRNLFTVEGLLFSALRRWKRHELKSIAARVCEFRRGTVLSGPFAGMHFDNTRSQGEILPKLIGSYESELHQVIERLIEHRFATIINVGAADGYYTVGMAVKCPQARVIAFEMNSAMRRECAENANMNKVEGRIALLGECDSEALKTLPLDNTLIIMDCEGSELDILNEDIAPICAATWFLIELHDLQRAGCSRILWQRFSGTHEMEFICALRKNPYEFDVLKDLTPRQKVLALDEGRMGAQEWVLMYPKL